MATETVNLDLHDAYTKTAVCGYTRDLILDKHQAQAMAARLRGIACITAVLMTEGTETELGEWMRGGLVEAVHALTSDTQDILERVNSRAEKEEKLAKLAAA